MENLFVEKIDQIIDEIESGDSNFYYYKDNNFHYIDNKKHIDFAAKVGNNSFSFKDNELGVTYIYSKKYLNEETTIQKIIVDDYDNKKCYIFMENDTLVHMLAYISTSNTESIVCKNKAAFDKDEEELIQYSNEMFGKRDLNSYSDDEEYDDFEDDEEYDDFEEEFDDLADERDIAGEILRDAIEEYYTQYDLKINNIKMDNKQKSICIPKYELEIEEVYYNCIILNEGMQNLKMVLEAIRQGKNQTEIEKGNHEK